MAPEVTIGIPFYNAGQALADAIRSIFAQTLTDWELILVDDGSTDSGLEVARSIRDARVRVVSDGRNLGLSARLNQIARLTSGEYLARMDADDLVHPDRLRVQLDFLRRRPEIDVVGTGMLILDEDGRPVGKRVLPMDVSAHAVLAQGAIAHATIVGRADWFRRNPYDSNFDGCEDLELWFRSFARSRFANLPGCYYFFREHSSFSLRKYATRCRTSARCYRRRAPAIAARGTVFAYACREELKPVIYAAATALGLDKRLLGRRSQPLPREEMERAQEVLLRVRSTPLPQSSEPRARWSSQPSETPEERPPKTCS